MGRDFPLRNYHDIIVLHQQYMYHVLLVRLMVGCSSVTGGKGLPQGEYHDVIMLHGQQYIIRLVLVG